MIAVILIALGLMFLSAVLVVAACMASSRMSLTQGASDEGL